MALKKCRECGQSVSSEAKTCPHCGVKKPVTQTSGWAWLVVILFVLVILGKGIGERDAGSGTPTPESPPPRRAISANPPASAAPPSS